MRSFRPISVLVAALAVAAPASAETHRLTIVHFGDTTEPGATETTGGLAAAAAIIQREKARSPNTLVTFGGDLLAPGILSGITRGAHMIELTNALGLDFAVVGNHEFDYGLEVFQQRLKESRFQWLAANLVGADDKPAVGMQATVIREIGGIKVGIMGLAYSHTVSFSAAGPSLRVTNAVDAAGILARQLRSQGADVVVALAHQSLSTDQRLMDVPGIDLVLSGNDKYPITMFRNNVLLLEAGVNAQFVGVINLIVDKTTTATGTKVTVRQDFRLEPTLGVAPDPTVGALLAKWEGQLGTMLDAPVATLGVSLDTRRDFIRRMESPISNLVADAMRAAMGADIGLGNAGGLRAEREYATGAALTRKDLMAELPLGNTMVLMEISGDDLRTALEQGIVPLRAVPLRGASPRCRGCASPMTSIWR